MDGPFLPVLIVLTKLKKNLEDVTNHKHFSGKALVFNPNVIKQEIEKLIFNGFITLLRWLLQTFQSVSDSRINHNQRTDLMNLIEHVQYQASFTVSGCCQ